MMGLAEEWWRGYFRCYPPDADPLAPRPLLDADELVAAYLEGRRFPRRRPTSRKKRVGRWCPRGHRYEVTHGDVSILRSRDSLPQDAEGEVSSG